MNTKGTNPRLTANRTMQEIAKFQFILSEGRKGNHLLFSPDIIRLTFSKRQEDLFETFQSKLEDINKILNHTFMIPSFEEKGEYIKTLPEDIQCALVYGYFQLLDGQEQGIQEPTLH